MAETKPSLRRDGRHLTHQDVEVRVGVWDYVYPAWMWTNFVWATTMWGLWLVTS